MRKICVIITAAIAVLLSSPLAVAAAEKPTSISSLSAVLYEPESGRFLYEKDADTPRPMASTTKLMTALIAAERLPLDSVITIPPQAVLVEGSSMGLRGEDRLTVRDLLAGLLLSSGNDAANALALLCENSLPAFADKMNQKAVTLGMKNTLFVTPSGLDEGDHHSTARDMALLGAAVLKSQEIARLCSLKTATIHIGDREATLSNHNRLLRLYPDAIGLKTGYTVKSGKCLVSAATRNGVTLVVATLNGGDYWNDHIALYEYGFSRVKSVPLEIPSLPAIAVAGGVQSTLSLTADAVSPAVVLNEETVSYRVQLPSFVWAPIRQGETIGTITYTVDERVVGTTEIKAAVDVSARPKQSFLKKWRLACRRLFTEWLR